MELKVVCYCGQKYKFDAEPVSGRMPYAVCCPVCGMVGTVLANQLISERLSSSAPPPMPAMAAPAMVAPAPIPAAPASVGSGLKINMARPAAPAVPPPLALGSAMPPPLPPQRSVAPVRPAVAAKAEPKEFSMGLGILGAILGAAVGSGLMYGFFYMTGFRFPLTGTAIGILSGIGARVLARGTDNTLGAIAAGISLASIVGLFFLMYGEFFVLGIFSIVACVYCAYKIASG